MFLTIYHMDGTHMTLVPRSRQLAEEGLMLSMVHGGLPGALGDRPSRPAQPGALGQHMRRQQRQRRRRPPGVQLPQVVAVHVLHSHCLRSRLCGAQVVVSDIKARFFHPRRRFGPDTAKLHNHDISRMTVEFAVTEGELMKSMMVHANVFESQHEA